MGGLHHRGAAPGRSMVCDDETGGPGWVRFAQGAGKGPGGVDRVEQRAVRPREEDAYMFVHMAGQVDRYHRTVPENIVALPAPGQVDLFPIFQGSASKFGAI